ncbi:MAG: helix-turn-helix domain-containing protein [Lacipirellulaceae bacterium]
MTSILALELPATVGARAVEAPAGRARPAAGKRAASSTRAHRAAPAPFYVAGPENRLPYEAVATLLAAANDPQALATASRWSPVVLGGPTGSGKSLLARGVFAAWRERFGDDEVLSLSIGDFRRRLDEAIASHRVEQFRERVRSSRLLVLEDLHRAPKSRHLHDELVATLDAAGESGALVVATTGKPLSESPAFGRALLSRFAAGLTLELSPPSTDARTELLRRTLEAGGRKVDAAALAELGDSLSTDGRRVLRVATKLLQRFGPRQAIGRDEVQTFVAEERGADPSPAIATITSTVARYYALPVREVRSSSRKQPVVLARAVAIYVARELTPLSYEELGRYFGGRDHTTVMHNYQRITQRLPKDRALRSAIEDVRRSLGGG